jgi:hypothetical protein
MNDLPHLQEVFDKLRGGHHLSPEDEPAFSAVAADYDAYAAHFAPFGLTLVRHPREFFYFEPETNESPSQTLPRIAVFSFVLIDYAANAGKPIEEFVLGTHFLISRLPHFTLDRYAALLRQVDVEDPAALRLVVKSMERLGWVKFVGEEEFRFLRPFHRVFDKCLELSRLAVDAAAAKPNTEGES